MKISDKFEHIFLKTVLEIFVPIFVLEHKWNAEDRYENLFKSKKQYLIKILINAVEQGRLKGEIVCYPLDRNCNTEFDEILDINVTWFDIQETFALLFSELKLNGSSLISTYLHNCLPNNTETYSELNIEQVKKNGSDEYTASPMYSPNVPTLDLDAYSVSINSTDCNDNQLVSSEFKYVFKHMNAYWNLTYAGKSTLVKDGLGMKYIAELLKHKYESIDWIELFNAVKGVNPDQVDRDNAFEDVSDGFDLTQGKESRIYAGKDKKTLQQEIKDLKEELEEAKDSYDYVKIDTLENQIEQITKYVLDTYRKDGTLKECSDITDKMINGIKAAIKRALNDIENELPDLRNHLNDCIVLKWQRSKPNYSPSIDIDWVL